jgi:fluoride exporter
VAETDRQSAGWPLDPDSEPIAITAAGIEPVGRRFWLVLLAIGVGGILGALARYAVSVGLPAPSEAFPWSTLIVNVSGSAVLGALLVVMVERFPAHRTARLLLGTGLIGAYTTFSTYTVQAVVLIRNGHPGTSVGYAIASLILGIPAAWGAMVGTRWALARGRR